MSRAMFLPVLRCRAKWCASAFVGAGDHCPRCLARAEKARLIAVGQAATRADMANHKRLSLRRRLGLLA